MVRCEHCQGSAYERIEMQFLSDVYVPCAVCEGRRFQAGVLAITLNGLLGRRSAGYDDQRRAAALRGSRHSAPSHRARIGLGYLTLGSR